MDLLKLFVKNLEKEISRSKYSNSSESNFDKSIKPIRKDLQNVENLTSDDLNKIIKKLDNPNNFKTSRYKVLKKDEEKERLALLAFSRRKRAALDLIKSEGEYLEALKIDPSYVLALEYLGELYFQTNQAHKVKEKNIYDRLQSANAGDEINVLKSNHCTWLASTNKGNNALDSTHCVPAE
jgi:hypothetical protein